MNSMSDRQFHQNFKIEHWNSQYFAIHERILNCNHEGLPLPHFLSSVERGWWKQTDFFSPNGQGEFLFHEHHHHHPRMHIVSGQILIFQFVDTHKRPHTSFRHAIHTYVCIVPKDVVDDNNCAFHWMRFIELSVVYGKRGKRKIFQQYKTSWYWCWI